MNIQDVITLQKSWPKKVSIDYIEKRGMTRAVIYLLSEDGQPQRQLMMTKPFISRDECCIELDEYIEKLLRFDTSPYSTQN